MNKPLYCYRGGLGGPHGNGAGADTAKGEKMDAIKAFYLSALSGALEGALSFFKPGEVPDDICESIQRIHRFFMEQSEEVQDLLDAE